MTQLSPKPYCDTNLEADLDEDMEFWHGNYFSILEFVFILVWKEKKEI